MAGQGYSVWGEHLPPLDGTAETANLWIHEVAQFSPSHFPRRMLAVEPLLSVHGQTVLAQQVTEGTLGEAVSARVLVAEGLLANPSLDRQVAAAVIRWLLTSVDDRHKGRSYRAALGLCGAVYGDHPDWFTPADRSAILIALATS